MTIRKEIPRERALNRLRICPLRFARAPHVNNPNTDTGPAHAQAPDPDDRGFLIRNNHGAAWLPVGFDEALAEAARPETRVRLIREDIENAADLYVSANPAARLDITTPATGTKLPNQQRMMIKFKAQSVGECYLEIRFGAQDGPIIHRLYITVQALRDVRVAAHVPQVNGTARVDTSGAPIPARSARTDAQIRAMMTNANSIYFPYGIRFQLDAAIDRAGALAFANRGMVNDMTNEFEQAMAHNRVNGAVNIYFVAQIGSAAEIDQVGGSATGFRGNPNTYGLLLADMAASTGQTIAHELGHVLNLVTDTGTAPRFIHVNTRQDPASPGTGRDVRDDMISRRRLMWAYTNMLANANMPYRDNVGYGNLLPGCMLAPRQLNADRTDWEMQEVRRAAANIAAAAGP